MWPWIAAEFFWSISVIVHSEDGNYCRLIFFFFLIIIFNSGLYHFFQIAQMVTLDNPKSKTMMLLQVSILVSGIMARQVFWVFFFYIFGASYVLEFKKCCV